MALGRKTGGRQPGSTNKVSGDLKHMILGALAGAGGEAYLQRQADENPGAFLSLIGKVLPMQVTGGEGGPVRIEVVTGVPRQDDD
jgi:hypothetical protein